MNMSVGAGIALLGIWGFAALIGVSKNVNGMFTLFAWGFALSATVVVVTGKF
jgi:hypothetical protein